MRLRDYQYLLDQCINLLNKLSGQIIRNNTNRGIQNDFKVIGLKSFNKAINLLKEHNLFEDKLKELEAIKYIDRASDDIVILQNEYNNLKSIRDNIITQAQNLKATIDNILPTEDEYSINIKLPEYKTFEEYNNLFKSLKTVFSTFDHLQYVTELKNFETGSKWITIKFEKPNTEDIKSIILAISILFNMANFSLDLRNKYLEGEKSIAYIKQCEIQANEYERKKLLDAYDILQKQNNEKYNSYKEQLIEKILKDSGLELDNTQKNDITPRISASMEKLGELLDDGLELKTALNAPEDIKQISENFNISLEEHKKIQLSINPQKLLEQKNDDKDVANEDQKRQGDGKNE